MDPDLASNKALAGPLARLAKVVLLLFSGASAVAVFLLVGSLLTEVRYDESRREQRLLASVQLRAAHLGQHLRLLVDELHRLAQRSEINVEDTNPEPERSLLGSSHKDSTFFNLGVALLSSDGQVLSAEPPDFFEKAKNLARVPWLLQRAHISGDTLMPVTERDGGMLYVVSPVIRNGAFTGALVGGIDPVRLQPAEDKALGTLVLATERGDAVYPEQALAYSESEEWKALFTTSPAIASVHEALLLGRPNLVAVAPVVDFGLFVAEVVDRDALLAPGLVRLRTRLILGLLLAMAPLATLVLLLRRALRQFRLSEGAAVREDRLHKLGEASNLIAHEVRNSLNGLRVGFDLVLGGQRDPNSRVVKELRAEIERLSSFTHQLMLFAKDPTPRTTRVDLAEVTSGALGLTVDVAAELGVTVELYGLDTEVLVDVDVTLIRIVISNLVANALDALAGSAVAKPTIQVTLEQIQQQVLLSIQDNGPGVDPNVAPTLFEPFVTGKPSGVGIGLALARRVARAHGGDLVLDADASGARFVLQLRKPTS